MTEENCEKSEKPVIYECPSCGSDETPQRHHFGGPKDGRNKECSCKSCGYQGLVEEFRIEWHYCVLCGDKYRDAEDLGLHLVRDHDANEDTAGDADEVSRESVQKQHFSANPPEEDPRKDAASEDVSEKSYPDTYNEIQRGLDKLRDAVKDQDWNRAKTFVGFTESKIEELEEFTQQSDEGGTE